MTYRSVLGSYQKPRALVSAANPRITDLQLVATAFTGGANQVISVAGDTAMFVGRKTYQLDIIYDNDRNDATLSGIGLRVFYNSSKLELITVQSGLDNFGGYESHDDTADFDVDPVTDSFIHLSWFDTNGRWPNVQLPCVIARLTFAVDDDITGDTSTNLNFTPSQTALGYSFRADTVPIEIHHVTWDIDKDGQLDALTDGILFIRSLFGVSYATGAVSHISTLTDTAVMANAAIAKFNIGDIDGDGFADALSDGILLLRYLFNLRGDDLVSAGVLSQNATRSVAEIEAYIEKYSSTTIYPDEAGGRNYGQAADADDVGSAIRAGLDWGQINLTTSAKEIAVAAQIKQAATKVAISTYDALIDSASVVESVASMSYPKISLTYSDIRAKIFAITRGTWVSDNAENIGLTDNLLTDVGKYLAETLEFNEDISTQRETYRTHTTLFGLSDNVSTLFGHGHVLSDGFSLQDTPSLGFAKAISDTIRLDSFFTESLGSIVDKSNLATVSDTVSWLANFKRGPIETVDLTSLVSIEVSKQIAEDPLKLSDSPSFLAAFYREPVENLVTADTVTFVSGRNATDAVSLLSDPQTLVQYKREPDDPVFTSESVISPVKYRRPILDTIRLDSFPSLAEANFADKSNLATLTDSIDLVAEFHRDPEDTLTLNESLSFDRGALKSDPLSLTDTFSTAVGFNLYPTETLSYTSQLIFSRTTKLSDSFGVGDSNEKEVGTSKFNYAFTVEAVYSAVTYRRPVLDLLRLDDSTVVSDQNFRDKANLATLTDTVALESEFYRSPQETVTFASAPSLGTTKNITEEALSLAEVFDTVSEFYREPLESVSLVSDITNFAFGKSELDGIEFSSAAAMVVGASKVETFDATETVLKQVKYRRPILDTIRLDSFPQLEEANYVDKSNLATLADQVTLFAAFSRTPVETVETASLVSKAIGPAYNTTFDVLDTTVIAAGFKRSLDEEILTPADTTVFSVGKSELDGIGFSSAAAMVVGASKVETFDATETVLKQVKYRRPILDTIRLDSFPSLAEANFADKSNLATLLDEVTLFAEFSRTPVETVATATLVSKAIGPAYNTTFDVLDTTVIAAGYNRELNIESLALGSSITSDVGKDVGLDTALLSSSISLHPAKHTSETFDATETVLKQVKYRRPILDTIRLDSFPQLEEANYVDKSNLATLLDEVSLFASFRRAPIETVSLASLLVLEAMKAEGDIVDLGDIVGFAAGYNRELNIESLALGSSITSDVGKDVGLDTVLLNSSISLRPAKHTSETFDATETVLKQVKYRRPILDTIRLDSFPSLAEANFADKSNLATLADQVTLFAEFSRTPVETVATATLVSKAVGPAYNTTFDVLDTTVIAAGYNRELNIESLALGSSITSDVGKPFSETVALSSQPSLAIDKNNGIEYASIVESIFTGVKYRRPILDLLRLDDSTVVSDQNYRDKSNLATLTDTVELSSSYRRTPDIDGISITSSASMGAHKSVGTESLTTFDQTLIEAAYFREVSADEVSLLTALTFSRTVKLSDSFGVGDSNALTISKNNGIEYAFTGESIFTGVKYRRPILDLLRLDDSTVVSDQNYRDKSNLATLTDTVELSSSYRRTPDLEALQLSSEPKISVTKNTGVDALSLLETVSISSGFNRSIAESISLTDIASVISGGNVGPETLGFSDEPNIAVNKNEPDSFGTIESMVNTVKYRRPVLDTIRLDSFTTLAESNFADKSNLATLTDTFSMAAGYSRSPEETLTLGSSTKASVTKPIGTESLTAFDQTLIEVAWRRPSLTDSLGVGDQQPTMSVSTSPFDALGITDEITLDFTGLGNFVTTIDSTENISTMIIYRRPVLDQVEFTDEITLVITAVDRSRSVNTSAINSVSIN